MHKGRPQFVLRPLCLALALTNAGHTMPAFSADVPSQPAQTGTAVTSNPVNAEDVPSLKKQPLDWVRSREYQKEAPTTPNPERLNFCRGIFVEPKYQPTPISNGTDPETHGTADHYNYDPIGRSVLEGNVVLRRGSEQLESNRVYLFKQDNKAQLDGDVQLRRPGLLVLSEHADLDLNNNSGIFYNTQYVMHTRQLHGRAEVINSNEDGSLNLTRAFFTSCEPGYEMWNLTGSTMHLDQKTGWGEATNARIEIKNIPIFYSPYVKFPIDNRRHTGLLFPEFGGSAAGGFEITQPVYLNLAPNYDATVSPRIITNRGTMVETEFRYLTEGVGHGTAGVAYLPNDRVFDDRRTLFSWHHIGDLKSRWTTNANYTYVSDPHYFEDLTTDLAATAQSHLERSAETEYRGDDWSFTGRLQGFQTIDPTVPKALLPYRRLPQLVLDSDLPSERFENWEYLFTSEYSYFDYPQDELPAAGIERSHRVRVEPGVRYRWEKPWGYISPTTKVRYAEYKMYDAPNSDIVTSTAPQNLNPSRTIPMFSLDSGVYFDRSINWGNTPITQTLEPRAFYLYSVQHDQNNFPIFDTADLTFNYDHLFSENRFVGGDRVGDANQMSLGFTSRLIDDKTGFERSRFSMGQIQYFADRKVRLGQNVPADSTPHSALVAENVIALTSAWLWSSAMEWNSDANRINTASTLLHYQLGNEKIVNLGYRYSHDMSQPTEPSNRISQTDISFIWPTSRFVSVIAGWGYNIDSKRSSNVLTGLQFESCCWKTRLIARNYIKQTDTPSNLNPPSTFAWYLEFELKGLPGFGNAKDKMIRDTVPGYVISRDKNY